MPRAERIAFIAPRFADGPTIGGAETLLRALADRAVAAGRSVEFLTTCARDHFTWKNEIPAGTKTFGDLTVRFFPVDEDRDLEAFLTAQDRICNTGAATVDDEDRWLANGVNSQALCDHLRANGDNYDRILIGPYLFGLGYFAGQVHPEKTWLVPCLHDESFAYMRRIGEMFQRTQGFLFNARPERDLACRLYDLDPARCHVVGMGLDRVDSDPARGRAQLPFEAPYVLYCGRREALKGTPLLLDYLDLFRARTGYEIKLVVTGSGVIEPSDALRPHCADLGFVSEQEKHDLMAGALCFCHPSVNESFSIVLMESWLAARPVLVHAASAVMQTACRESGGGLWFRTYPEFEAELELMLTEAALADGMGAAGRAFVEREYAWPVIERKMLAALDSDPPPLAESFRLALPAVAPSAQFREDRKACGA